MNDYRITLKLRSALGSLLQSDTLFGHLCWQVAFGRWSGGGIDDFLEPFRRGEPPFVLSDGFPAGVLPKPLAWRAPRFDVLNAEVYAQTKRVGKSRFVTETDFQRICRGENPVESFLQNAYQTVEFLHAKLDRITHFTSGEGDLFQTEDIVPLRRVRVKDESWESRETDQIVIYARCQPGWIEIIEQLLKETARCGYGRDKSVGLGAFQVASVEPFNGFAKPPGANAFVTLSSYVPATDDPQDGCYRLRTKYGKLSEIVESGNPFKRPILQIEPGACFFTGGEPKPWYGTLVEKIAPGKPEAVQCCYTLAVAAVFPKRMADSA